MITKGRFFSTILRQTNLEHDVKLSVRHGDVCYEVVDAIVNNANSYLIHDDGLAFSIAAGGGPTI